jgi:hypothetical protein
MLRIQCYYMLPVCTVKYFTCMNQGLQHERTANRLYMYICQNVCRHVSKAWPRRSCTDSRSSSLFSRYFVSGPYDSLKLTVFFKWVAAG